MTAHFVNLLDELLRRSLRMASAVEHMLAEACDAARRLDAAMAQRIIDRDRDVDEEEVAIETETLRLMTLFQPMGADMRQLCTILKVNSDLERIADCAVNIAQRVYHVAPGVMEELGDDLEDLYPAVRRMLQDVLHAYAKVDVAGAQAIRAQDAVVDALYGQFIQKAVSRAAGQPPEMLAAYMDVLSIAKNLERIADHATNIAEDVIYLGTGRIVRHSIP